VDTGSLSQSIAASSAWYLLGAHSQANHAGLYAGHQQPYHTDMALNQHRHACNFVQNCKHCCFVQNCKHCGFAQNCEHQNIVTLVQTKYFTTLVIKYYILIKPATFHPVSDTT
jgi:hypothetical protein